ncbi:MAG: hypothetical protein KF820_07640 [Candidatus Paracaedibacteraceae bacterium]|nr:hypothetical protein [Candidatus Paracaedibacteraceae bacterium]
MFVTLIVLMNVLFASDIEDQIEVAASSSQSQEVEVVYHTLSELLTDLRKTQRQALNRPSSQDEDSDGCCCAPAQSCHTCCCNELKVVTRIFWTVAANTTWTITALSDYVRRSMIPLAALGQYDKNTREKLLTWIGILQVISETCETIHDFSSERLTARERKLMAMHEQRKREKEYARTKALRKCTDGTLSKLGLEQGKISGLQARQLRKLYEPTSHALTAVEEELADEMDLTGCERWYNKTRQCFWKKSYPVFWVLGIGLSMAQMLVIATDLVKSEDLLALSILIISVEALQYFSKRMKHIGQDETYQTTKLRKDYSLDEDSIV